MELRVKEKERRFIHGKLKELEKRLKALEDLLNRRDGGDVSKEKVFPETSTLLDARFEKGLTTECQGR